jgi:uncharacterized protein DUF3551
MRHVIGVGALMVIALSANPAVAQDYPYCLQGGAYGYPGNCQFTGYRQCQATASGTLSYCGFNPRFAFSRQPHPRAAYQVGSRGIAPAGM